MKKQLNITLSLGIITAGFILQTLLYQGTSSANGLYRTLEANDEQLKMNALQVLKTKCNTCHRKQNPFMVFNQKNMVKRASKIYRMVYVEKRMPKGKEVRLTNEEYSTLQQWLFTQNIFQ